MSLSCSCGSGDFERWYYPPEDFDNLKANRRQRCYSCGKLIDLGSDCLIFERQRSPYTYIEEKIYGDEVPLANKYMCGPCGEIFLNLTAIGYCINIGGHMKEELREYWDITGFQPTQIGPQ